MSTRTRPAPAPVTQAVVTAAGLGTRMQPGSLLLQKELLPVAGIPALELLMWELVDQGFDRLVVVTGSAGPAVETLVRDVTARGLALEVAVIAEVAPLGLGHAVATAEAETGERAYALMLGDVIIEQGHRLIEHLASVYAAHQPSAVLAVSPMPEHVLHRFGCVSIGPGPAGAEPDIVRVTGLVEKPAPGRAPSPLAVIGRYLLAPGIVGAGVGPGETVDLAAALDRTARDGQVLAVVIPRCWHDVGDPESAVEAAVGIALERGLLSAEAVDRIWARVHAARGPDTSR